MNMPEEQKPELTNESRTSVSNLENSCALIGSGNTVNHNNITTTTISSPVTSSLPPPEAPLSNFAGRHNFLDELHDKVVKTESGVDAMSRTTVMTGLGGIGKSSAARKYADKYPAYHGGNVAWINARDYGSMVLSFLLIAQHLKICGDLLNANNNNNNHQKELGETDVVILVKNVYEHFSNYIKKGLFIFDSANQLRSDHKSPEIFKFLPNEKLDHLPLFLVTTRITGWCTEVGQTIELGTWEPPGSRDFLIKALKLPQNCPTELENSLDKLGHTLGNYPLALNIAASRILNSAILKMMNHHHPAQRFQPIFNEIERYILNFATKGVKWTMKRLPDNSPDRYDHIIDTVWTESITAIEKQKDGPLAIYLLYIMSVLPYEFINVDLLHCIQSNVTIDHNGCHVVISPDEKRRVIQALNLLHKWSMVQILDPVAPATFNGVLETEQNIRIHRLVKKWARVRCVIDNNLTPFNYLQEYLGRHATFLPQRLINGVHHHVVQLQMEADEFLKKQQETPTPLLETGYLVTQKNLPNHGTNMDTHAPRLRGSSAETRMSQNDTNDRHVEAERKKLQFKLEAEKKKLHLRLQFIDKQQQIRSRMADLESVTCNVFADGDHPGPKRRAHEEEATEENDMAVFSTDSPIDPNHRHPDDDHQHGVHHPEQNSWDPTLALLMLICGFALHILDWLVWPQDKFGYP